MTDISSRSRISSIALVFLLVISSMMFVSPATQAQPSGVQSVILRPDGDDLAGWNIVYPPTGDAYPWLAVDETTVGGDGDATWATISGGNSYWYAGFTAPTPDGTITSVDVWMWVKTVGSNTFYSYLGHYPDGGYSVWLTSQTLTSSYVNYSATGVTAPPVGGWTWANLNTESISLHPSDGTPACFDVRVTQIGMIVHTTTTTFIMRPDSTDFGGGWGLNPLSVSHFARVDETTSGGNGDADYVETNTDGLYDRYNVTDLPLGSSGAVKSITSITTWTIAKRTAVGASNLKTGVYIGTTYYQGQSVSLTADYVNYSVVWNTNPATTVAWALSEVQSLILYQMSSDATPSVRVTQRGAIVTVNYGWASTFTSSPPAAPHFGYWWPNDAYSYTVTLNESATLANNLKPAFLTWTSGNSTLWGRLAITITTQTASVVFQATSTNGKQCSWQNYSFNIVNTAPTFSSTPVYTINAITNYYYDANAADPEALTLYYDLEGNYTSATIDHATGVVERAQPQTVGWYWINITAFDGLYTTYQSFQMTVTYVTSFFTSSPIIVIHWSTNYHYDAEVTSSYSITFDFETNWTGATISSDTGEVNRTAPHTVGWYYVHVNVSDGYAVYWQNYSVNVTNSVPYFTSTPDYVVVELFDYSYNVDATQVPSDGDSLTYGLETNWSGATIDPSTGVISKTQPHVVGWYYLNVNVTDGYILVWQNFTVNVTDAWGPTFTSSPVTTVYSHAAYVYHITWNESVSDITFSSNASWLAWIDSIVTTVTGTSPYTNITLQFWVNVTAKSVNGGLVSYNNWTVIVLGTTAPTGLAIGPLESTTLSLILGFGLLGMALIMRDKRFWLITLSGMVWILAGVLVYPDYDAGWVILTIGFGIALLYEGTTGLMESRKK